jgi:galactonate dehydratase
MTIFRLLIDPTVFQFESGFVPLLKKPGLGIEINEAKVREMAQIGHRWRSPVWRNVDGSVTEW